MRKRVRPFRVVLASIGAVAIAAMGGLGRLAAQGTAPALASHRAIYELKLSQTRGKLAAARGLIVYDFSGNACEGYALQFRQVTELDNGEGKLVVSDLRSTTWEDGAGKSYRFNFQNYLNENLVDSVDGMAERRGNSIQISLKQPAAKRIEVPAPLVFPTEQMRQILTAARAGKAVLDLPVYDGSESGEKLYNTLSVIGHPIPANERNAEDAAAQQPALAELRRWPVTISYFDKAKANGEQTPAYAITFELLDNGISRALSLDYGDFSLSGKMTSLELRKNKPCP
jgi:hypothetical protein